MSDVQLTFHQAQEAVFTKWKTEWALLHPTMLTVYPSEHTVEEEPWTGSGELGDELVPVYWCRVSFQLLPGGQYTLGKRGQRLFRREAVIWVQIFGPQNNGTGGHLTLIDEINGFLEGESFDGIDPNGAVNPTAVGDEGKWYQYSVTYPVAFYQLK